MARNISISFSLSAALTGGFKGAFQSAASSARNVASAIREMEKSPVGHLGSAMAQQREKIKGLAGSLKEAKATLATLQSQAQASGGATGMLARQIELAQSRVNNLNGAMQRQLGIWRNTTAQAATTGGSIRRLSQEYDHLSQRIERARRVQAAMAANRAQADALRSQRADLNSRLTGAMAAGATVAIPAKLSIDFEQSIANVGAVSNASDEDLKRLTDTARQLGRDTMFSASEAAEGMKYLAMAGFNTEQTIAAMPGLLDLAAASATDLGTTSDIASDILTAFNLKASDMGEVGNILTRAFTNSNTDLSMLGETMKYVAPVAASLGMTLDQTAAYAGAMANAGIKASQGGTVLRAAMLRLAAPPKASRDALGKLTGLEGEELEQLQEELEAGAEQLAKLGMSTKDAQGNMRPLVDILEELNVRTKDMGNADKAAVFKNIFGTEASAGMINLAAQADKTIDDTGKQIVDSAGNATSALRKMLETTTNQEISASKVAKKQMDTTGGSLKILSSAWQDAGISVGNLFLPAIQMAAGALSTIANVISATVNRFPLLSKGIALAVGGIIALTAASVGIGLVMNFVRTGLNGFRGGLLRLSAAHVAATASTTASTAAAGGFGIASRIAGAGAKFFAGGLRSILMATGVGALLVGLGFAINLLIDNWDAVVAAMSAAWDWVKDTWSRFGVFFSELGKNLGEVVSGWGETLTGWVKPVWNWITGVWNGITGFFGSLFDGVANIAGSVWGGVVSLVTSPVESIKAGWNSITSFFSGLWNSATNTASSFGSGIVGVFKWAKDFVVGYWNGLISFYSGLWKGIKSGVSAVWNGIVSVFTWAKDIVVGYWKNLISFYSGLWNGIKSGVSAVWNGIISVFTWAKDIVVGCWKNLINFYSGLWNGIKSGVSAIWNGVVGVFLWAKDKVIGVWNGITSFFSGLWNGIVSGASSIGQGILSVFSVAKNAVMVVWSGITGFFSGIANAITGVFTWAMETISSIWQGLAAFFSGLWGAITDSAASLWDGISSLAAWAFETVIGIWNGAVEFFSGIVNNISAAFAWAANGIDAAFAWARDGVVGIWNGVAEFFGSIGQQISGCFLGVWQDIENAAAAAWATITGIWNGAVEFFTGIVDSIYGVFKPLFDWFKEKFAWVLGAIDTVKSAASSVMGAITGAFNSAFGGDEKKNEDTAAKAANGDKATPAANAHASTEKPVAPNAEKALKTQKETAVAKTKYEPVSAETYRAALEQKKGQTKAGGGGRKSGGSAASSGGGGRAKSSGGSGGSRAGVGKKSNSSPVTVVTLDSGNEIKTQFIPAPSSNAAGNANWAAARVANQPAQVAMPAKLTVEQESPSQPDKGFMANAMSALKFSGIGGVIGQGLTAGIGMAKSALGIGQTPQDSAAAQAAKTPIVQTTILSEEPERKPLTGSVGVPAPQPVLARAGSALRHRWEQCEASPWESALTVAASPLRGLQTAGQPALPQAPAMIAKKQGQKSKEAQYPQGVGRIRTPEEPATAAHPGQQGISIDITQNFDLITQDAGAARKVLEAIRPDMEALIRRALEKISSDRRRKSYAQ